MRIRNGKEQEKIDKIFGLLQKVFDYSK